MRITTRFLCAFFALSMFAAARPGSISGRVIGADGAPLKDVHVSISGSIELAGHGSVRQRFVVEPGRDTTIELQLATVVRQRVK